MIQGLVLLMILAVAMPAESGSITFDFGSPLTLSTTAAQDAAIQKLVDAVNTRRAAATPPLGPITREQYLRSILVDAVASYVKEVQVLEAVEACMAYTALTTVEQDDIKTRLGGRAPCNTRP